MVNVVVNKIKIKILLCKLVSNINIKTLIGCVIVDVLSLSRVW